MLEKQNQKIKTSLLTIYFSACVFHWHFFFDILQKECSECAELHAIAKDAKSKIQKIQEDFNRRVDQSNKGLTAKHKQEVGYRLHTTKHGAHSFLC